MGEDEKLFFMKIIHPKNMGILGKEGLVSVLSILFLFNIRKYFNTFNAHRAENPIPILSFYSR